MKYLGVLVDELTFKDHVELVKKIEQMFLCCVEGTSSADAISDVGLL